MQLLSRGQPSGAGLKKWDAPSEPVGSRRFAFIGEYYP